MKKLLSFRGPQHHGQIMRPVEEAVANKGWEVVRYTADTEGCFQAGLNEELGLDGYDWLPDHVINQWDGQASSMYDKVAPYFQELLQKPNALSLMAPQILDRIVFAICREFQATRRLLEVVKPDACLVLHELNRWGMLLGYLASRKGIPVYSMQEGLYYGDPWLYTGHTRYSKSLVWGEATKKKLLDAGCGEDRVIVVGHPDLGKRYDVGGRTKDEAWSVLPPEMKGRKLCLVFFTNVEVTEGAVQVMEGIEQQEEWGFVARIHQLASAPHIERVRNLFNRKGCYFSDNSNTFGHHWQLMSLSDALIVVGCSSTFLEWAANGKPMGQVRSNVQFRDFAAEGIAVDCIGIPLVQAVKKVVSEWPVCQDKAASFVREEIADMNAAPLMGGIIVGK